MKDLNFIRPTKDYEQQAYEYIQEFNDYNSAINGVGGLNRYIGDYDGWLKKLEEDRTRTNIGEKVPAETFFLIRKSDNKLLGIINIRLALNAALLEHGGHIGYGVRPTERKKGYNSYQLYCALKFCKEKGLEKVLLTCNKDNIGSAKTIQNNCGVLEDGELIQRYWINVEETLEKGKEKYENNIKKTR